MSLAHQRGQERFYDERGTTREQYDQLGRGKFVPAASRRRPQAFFHPRPVGSQISFASRAASAQDTPTSSTTVSHRDYNVNVMASSLVQQQQRYQPEIRNLSVPLQKMNKGYLSSTKIHVCKEAI